VRGRVGRGASPPPVDVERDLPRLFLGFDAASLRRETALAVTDLAAGANCFLLIAVNCLVFLHRRSDTPLKFSTPKLPSLPNDQKV
jgi:hypothetical protein